MRVFVDASVGVNVNELVGRVDGDVHGHGSGRVGTDDTQYPTVSNIDAVDAAVNAAENADVGVDVVVDPAVVPSQTVQANYWGLLVQSSEQRSSPIVL